MLHGGQPPTTSRWWFPRSSNCPSGPSVRDRLARPPELMALPGVRDKIRSEIDRLSTDWKGYERVERFALILEDFTLENGMLTPSLKLRRHQAAQRWRAELDALYQAEASAARR